MLLAGTISHTGKTVHEFCRNCQMFYWIHFTFILLKLKGAELLLCQSRRYSVPECSDLFSGIKLSTRSSFVITLG